MGCEWENNIIKCSNYIKHTERYPQKFGLISILNHQSYSKFLVHHAYQSIVWTQANIWTTTWKEGICTFWEFCLFCSFLLFNTPMISTFLNCTTEIINFPYVGWNEMHQYLLQPKHEMGDIFGENKVLLFLPRCWLWPNQFPDYVPDHRNTDDNWNSNTDHDKLEILTPCSVFWSVWCWR